MLYNPGRRESSLDPGLVWSAALLFAIGLVMVYSASIAMAEAEKFTGYRPGYFLVRHGLYLCVGMLLAAALFRVPLWLWQKAAPWLFFAGSLVLIAVLVPGLGREVNGARRWIPLGFATFQPSEVMKLLVVLYAADYTVRKAAFMDDVRKGFLPMFGVMTLIAALLLREPDFGALVVVTSIAMAVLFLGGLNWRLFAGLAALLAVAFVALIVSSPYRLQRILGFMDPWYDAYGKGYQLSHSLIAFGRGEWLGVGLGASIEKLFYLPEAHTDFLLAVIAEELGFAGVATVIVLFLCLVHRAFAVGRQAASLERYFAALVAQGIGVWLARAGVHQHGREHGPAAHQGPHAAAALVRRHRHRRELHGARDPAQDRLGESLPHARRFVVKTDDPHHGGAAPADTSSRAWRSPRSCAARGWSVHWMGTPAGMENRLVREAGYPMTHVNMTRRARQGRDRVARAAGAHPRSRSGNRRSPIFRIRPDVVLSLGGYVAFPGGMMAALWAQAPGGARAGRRGRHHQPRAGAGRRPRDRRDGRRLRAQGGAALGQRAAETEARGLAGHAGARGDRRDCPHRMRAMPAARGRCACSSWAAASARRR